MAKYFILLVQHGESFEKPTKKNTLSSIELLQLGWMNECVVEWIRMNEWMRCWSPCRRDDHRKPHRWQHRKPYRWVKNIFQSLWNSVISISILLVKMKINELSWKGNHKTRRRASHFYIFIIIIIIDYI